MSSKFKLDMFIWLQLIWQSIHIFMYSI